MIEAMTELEAKRLQIIAVGADDTASGMLGVLSEIAVEHP